MKVLEHFLYTYSQEDENWQKNVAFDELWHEATTGYL
jgi:hypothetical protein